MAAAVAADYGPGSSVYSIASATPTGLVSRVANYPPGKSKYNPIEHPLFCEISENWAGGPLLSWELILNFIITITTHAGFSLSAHCSRRTTPLAP